ncbi:MAG: carboxypeptidase regulatory-like domain-containing protein [Vicinamibacteria bacterium]|nr:carboxypeptidase regulatory-like domain-containing protein [Vicinamibacteria bacterium]
MFRKLLVAAVALLVSTSAFAQSQAQNGLIEGSVKDSSGGVLPGVSVVVTNVSTGETKTFVTDSLGKYRAPLLSLGAYKVRVELSGFKSYERAGFSLSAGDTMVVNAVLETGVLTETVTVTGEAPIASPGKVDIGRTISEGEVKNLPLVSRNPYNFAFLQPNVTGYENNEFGAARINGNGSQMHVNYQLDGNTNTEKDRAGLRLLPVSEIVVKEVKVVTSGFAPEFGQTTGMVYNAITPSGTNALTGTASFRFRRKNFSNTPFYFTGTQKPDTHVNNYNFTLGGPIKKDKTHFYVGYEFVDRDLSADRLINQSVVDNYAAVGLTKDQAVGAGVMPATQKVHFAIAKIDHQFNASHKLSLREFWFKNDSPYNVGGGATTIQRATDFNDKMNTASAQLISQFGGSRLNELRVQYAQRDQSRVASDSSVTGPAINITGAQAISFGSPLDGTASAGFIFNTKIFQVVNNFSWTVGKHSMKAGVDFQHIADTRQNTLRAIYSFTSVASYLAAKNGTNPRGYSSYTQDLGDPTAKYSSNFIGLFVQDDVWLSSRLKLLYGIRYDLFDVPKSRVFAANPLSTEFKDDKNNLAARVGFSWSLDAENRTVLRASSGIMYEPPQLNMYEDAILRNGDPKSYTFTGGPTVSGAPAFPATIGGATVPKQGIAAVALDFKTQWALLSNIQIERALSDDISASIGYINSIGRNMPLVLDTNLTATTATLSDGRPIYSSTRPNTQFNAIDVAQSIGEGTYNALTVTLQKRMRHGWQMQANYTLAKSTDNAPFPSYVLATGDDRISDPSSIDRDKGVAPFNQTHTFALSTLLQPKIEGSLAPIINNNQLGIIVQANSGLPFNIRTNRDLNNDGNAANDRPLGIGRNTGRLGRVFNVDARYVRFINFGKRRLEIFGEAKNVFNNENVSGVNRVVATDALGNPTTAIPSKIILCGSPAVTPCATSAYDQRSMQVGAKITF